MGAIFNRPRQKEKKSNTVLLLSHFDVVDTADYGEFKHMACKVPELMDLLNDKKNFCLNGSKRPGKRRMAVR